MRSSKKLILCGCLAAAFTGTATAQPTNIAVAPSSGTGTVQSFAFQASSPNGAADLSQITAMFNYAIDGYGSCFVVAYPALNSISLMDDAGNWPAFQTLGTSGSMQNSQCTLNLAASSLQTSLNTVTLNLALTFKPGLPGRQNVYMESWNAAGLTSGWQQMGTWDTNTATIIYQPPALLDVQPASGTGLAQTFTFRATSVNGYQYLTQLHAIFDITPSAVARCWIYYNRLQNYVYLMNDTQTDWFAAHMGDGGVISNGQCSVNASASSVSATGANELDVHLALTFNPAWAGLKYESLYVEDRAAATAGFTQMGTWTVGTAATPPGNVSISPASGTGTVQTFAFQASSPNGAADLTQITAMFNYTIDGYGSCYVVFYPAANSISLMDDVGNWPAFQTLGTPGNLQNSQCLLNVAASNLQTFFNTVTLNLALTFKPGLPGRQNVYMQSWNTAGLTSGWQQMGTWDTNTATIIYQPPALLDVQPASGAGLAQTFTFRATSVNGYQYLTQLHAIFDITPSAVARCWIYYNRLQNYVYLMNDTQTDWFAAHIGDGGVISNSQCSVNANASSVSATGANELDVHLALTFNPAWAGLKYEYLYVEDRAAATAGFTQMGTWTVGALAPITFQSTPSGRSIQVDGATYITPVTLQLSPGSHTLDASVSQNPPAGTRYNFLSWSDGGAAAHTVTTSSAATYTANFTTQYQLTTNANPGGTISQSDPSGWYTNNTQATVTATANPGYQFSGFSGTITSTTNPLSFTMNVPSTLAASFASRPPAYSVTPSFGAGASQILTAAYIDPVAFGQITEALLLVNSSTATASACYVKWTTGNHFYLRNDTDSAWLDGTTASVQNSQCRLDAPANGAQGAGQTLTVNFGLTFFSAFSGAKSVYLSTTSASGTAPWQQAGTWTVDRTSGDYTVTATTPNGTTAQLGTVQYQYEVRAIGGIDGSSVRVRNQGVYIPSTPNCLGGWDQQSGWDAATRTGTVTLWITASSGCGGGFTYTYTPEITWASGAGSGVSKTTTDTTLTCCTSAPVSITLTPTSTTLRGGQSTTFIATVKNAANPTVTWDTPSIGTLTQYGLYTAPPNISTTQYVVITAHSNQDYSKTGSATITLQPTSNLPSYTVSGQVQQPNGTGIGGTTFEVRNAQNALVATTGTDSNGNYSIPQLTAGQYTVKATSPYGTFSPASITYDLAVLPGPHVENRRLRTMSVCDPDVCNPPPTDGWPPRYPVRLAIGSTTVSHWYFPDGKDAGGIQSCWASASDGSATPDVHVTTTCTPEGGAKFKVTFIVDASATAGPREFYTRYKFRIDDKDVLQDLVGQDFLVLFAFPTMDRLDIIQPVTPNAAPPFPPAPAVMPVPSTNTSSLFATAYSTDLVTVVKDSGTVSVTAVNLQPTDIANQIQWIIDRDPGDTVEIGKPTLTNYTGMQTSFEPSKAGNFRLTAYFDTDGNGSFDEGEQLRILRIAVVRATLQPLTGSFTRAPVFSDASDPVGVDSRQARVNTSIMFPAPTYSMSLQADYLLEGGGGDRSVGTVHVMIGDVGNLLNDTFQVTYPVPVPAPPAPGNVLGTGTENTGGTTPMLDCCFGQPAGYQPKLGGFEVFRNNSFFVQLPPPSSGGRLLRLTSLDAPVFGWDFVHSKTGNPWGTTSDSNQFREFIVAVSDSFTHTYTALNRADWTIAIVGTRDGDHWVNNGSFIAGDDSLQPVDGLHVQVLGLSFALQNWMKYLP